MPYGGTTPAQDAKIDRCKVVLMRDKDMIRKYPDPKVRETHVIAICKSSVMQ